MIRVFPRRTAWTPTDDLAFVGDPPLFRPPEQPVRVSVTFTWDIPEGKRLYRAWSQYYSDVQIGGPAFADPGGNFTPGQFVKTGVTITSRGCIRYCPWCVVPDREGCNIREYPIMDGWIVQDNNLLACSRPHILAVFDMLRRQKRGAIFSGGLDARLLQPWHLDALGKIRINELWFACDTPAGLGPLENIAERLKGIPLRKKRCYVMIGYGNESLYYAERRLQRVFELGFLPFSQLYRDRYEPPKKYPEAWEKLNRKWSRPAIYRRHKDNVSK